MLSNTFLSPLPHLLAAANTKPGCTFATQLTPLRPAARLQLHVLLHAVMTGENFKSWKIKSNCAACQREFKQSFFQA